MYPALILHSVCRQLISKSDYSAVNHDRIIIMVRKAAPPCPTGRLARPGTDWQTPRVNLVQRCAECYARYAVLSRLAWGAKQNRGCPSWLSLRAPSRWVSETFSGTGVRVDSVPRVQAGQKEMKRRISKRHPCRSSAAILIAFEYAMAGGGRCPGRQSESTTKRQISKRQRRGTRLQEIWNANLHSCRTCQPIFILSLPALLQVIFLAWGEELCADTIAHFFGQQILIWEAEHCRDRRVEFLLHSIININDLFQSRFASTIK